MQNTPELSQSTEIASSSPITQDTTTSPVTEPVKVAEPTSDEFKLESPKETEDEIPEWGKKDPTAFMQYKLGKNNKKHAHEISELKRKMDEQNQLITRLQSLTQPNSSVSDPSFDHNQSQNGSLFDPITGTYVSPSDPQYGMVLREQQKAYYEKSQSDAMRVAEQQRLIQEETEKFIDRLEEAKTKFNDYDEVVNSVKITPTILETAKLLPNGTDLLYYLAKNPKEVNRIINLPDYLQAKEMIKHSINIGVKKVSNAPAPAKPLESGESESKPKLANMSGPQLSQYRREQLKARYKR